MAGKRDKKPGRRRLGDDDIVTTDRPSRRSALMTIGAGLVGSVVLGTRQARASDPADQDVTTVADYKWGSDRDETTYGDAKPQMRDYRDIGPGSDLADTDVTRYADPERTVDSDVRRIADPSDQD